MLSRWPIRNKLLLGIALLMVIVGTLFGSAYYGLYAYRGLVKSLSLRSRELPLASELGSQVSNLHGTLSRLSDRRESELREIDFSEYGIPSEVWAESRFPTEMALREEFNIQLDAFRDTLRAYESVLWDNFRQGENQIGDAHAEKQTLREINEVLERIDVADASQVSLSKEREYQRLLGEVDSLATLAAELPSHLHKRLLATSDEVASKYRIAIVTTWLATLSALLVSAVFIRLFYRWIFYPLRVLVNGSRRVAQGEFKHRIRLETHDEMSELADAMNNMTSRFQATRDDLDDQVQIRTKQVVRSEQLASVGFLAAGVAHEINNPLASIALCSESLESRVAELLEGESEDHKVIRDYLRMIQDEAFRCKQITEKLLDFSRMGETDRQTVDLRELVESVIEMVSHLGKYRDRTIEFAPGAPVFAQVNAQEFKQVAINLIANGLDSIERSGKVMVAVRSENENAVVEVVDEGCGMTDEVLEHLFEPFFTRRRQGEGTGLGLSITYRIVADHEGHIEATSEGPGKGSRFVVTVPLADRQKHQKKEREDRYQAA